MHVARLLLLALLGSCTDAPPASIDEGASAPTPAMIQRDLTATYKHPEKHAVVAVAHDAETISWNRTYDGIAVSSEGRSGLERGQWKTRIIPELAEPPLVPPGERLSFDEAATKLGIVDDLRTGAAVARYVYAPVYVEIPNKPAVTNAADVDLFVEKYVLVVELQNEADKTIALVDATSGALISRASRERTIEVPDTISMPTFNYNWPSIDVTANRVGSRFVDYNFKDISRCSRVYVFGSTRCLTGQGVLADGDFYPPDPRLTNTITYADIATNIDGDAELDFRNDIAFGLQMSWDYFATVHGRRGLRGLPASAEFTANDAIAFIDDRGWEYSNANMDTTTGLMTFKFIRPGPGRQAELERLTRLDIVGHEWSHGVWASLSRHNETGDFYWGESGGLDESTADLFGILIEGYGRRRLGLQVDVDAVSWRAADRDMCTPSTDGRSHDNWFPGMNTMLVNAHQASGPVNRVHCLIARGLRPFGTSNDVPGLQSVYVREPGFAGLGVQTVERLWYRTLYNLRNVPSPVLFVNAREAELAAAEELYGLHSPAYKAVQDAWAAVMVGLPANRTPPTVTLLSGAPLTPTNRQIEVAVADADGVKDVKFELGGPPPCS